MEAGITPALRCDAGSQKTSAPDVSCDIGAEDEPLRVFRLCGSVLSQKTLEDLVESLRLLEKEGVPGLGDDLEF